MFRLLAIFTLIATASSMSLKQNGNAGHPPPYRYFDPKAKAAAEKILSMPDHLNEVLTMFTNKYKPSERLEESLLIYQASAELVKGTDCAVDQDAFMESLEHSVNLCATVVASDNSKQSMMMDINHSINAVQEADKILQEAGKSSKSGKGQRKGKGAKGKAGKKEDAGSQDSAKAYAMIKSALGRTLLNFQKLIHSTRAKMKDCMDKEMVSLLGEVNRQILGILEKCQ